MSSFAFEKGSPMSETQSERLDLLVEAFKADSGVYRNLETPPDTDGRRRLLRSLMNVRPPRALDAETLRVQDAYLKDRAAELGVIDVQTIPTIEQSLGSKKPHADVLSIWQGDITRLKCDAIVNAANSEMLGCFRPMHTCIDKSTHIRITHPLNYIMASC